MFWSGLVIVGFVWLLMGAAYVAPPPYAHTWLTTNLTAGTFTDGQVPSWNSAAKKWTNTTVSGSSGGATQSIDQVNFTDEFTFNEPELGGQVRLALNDVTADLYMLNGGSMFIGHAAALAEVNTFLLNTVTLNATNTTRLQGPVFMQFISTNGAPLARSRG